MTLQQMADIAMRWATATSDAMIAACVRRHRETGEPLRVKPRREARGRVRVIRADDVDWERLMRENGDTRWNHC